MHGTGNVKDDKIKFLGIVIITRDLMRRNLFKIMFLALPCLRKIWVSTPYYVVVIEQLDVAVIPLGPQSGNQHIILGMNLTAVYLG